MGYYLILTWNDLEYTDVAVVRQDCGCAAIFEYYTNAEEYAKAMKYPHYKIIDFGQFKDLAIR